MGQKIGIYSGTFDPIHQGHIDFALVSIAQLQLEKLIIIPEKQQRYKVPIASINHRINMIKRVFQGNNEVEVKNIITDHAEFPLTLDELGLKHAYILVGTDTMLTLKAWNVSRYDLGRCHFVVGVRDKSDEERVVHLCEQLGISDQKYTFIRTTSSGHSSTAQRQGTMNFHPKIEKYLQEHSLYGL